MSSTQDILSMSSIQSNLHAHHQQTQDAQDVQPAGKKKTQIMASLAVSTGSMMVGFCSAWSSPAIASMQEPGSGIEVSFSSLNHGQKLYI